jgi:tetratricopeptide (TPR) repeat protein
MLKSFFLLMGSMCIAFMGYNRIYETAEGSIDREARSVAQRKILRTGLRCSPDWSEYSISLGDLYQMIPLPGTGTHEWKISTKSDSAQFYFNQGINLYYGFHIIEALPSFYKAIRFDSTCAMLYWGVALAYGPNINDYGYAQSPYALQAVAKALQLSSDAAPKEKVLIDAMNAHYSKDTTHTRDALNHEYADKMKLAYASYPDDAEIGALYADALMNLHPWDFWDHDGKPKAWTPELMKLLETVLEKSPMHPGANHYYIHTMEASPFASKATASADRLQNLAPGLSHMVHMPSHIYIRTGEYGRGVKVNEDAVKMYYDYKKLFPDVVNGAFLYENHNLHMQAASSMNANDYEKAIRDAMDCQKSVDTSMFSLEAPMGNFMQYLYMTPDFTWITFQKWNEILQQPIIQKPYHYGRLIREFARGLAYANTNQIAKAKISVTIIDSILMEKDMQVVLTPFNAAVTGGRVAKYILKGCIAENQNQSGEAIEYYKIAVATEDSLVYQEPRDWLVPARHFLGNALLKEKKYKEAEMVFQQDLVYQPKNYISVRGLNEAKKHNSK